MHVPQAALSLQCFCTACTWPLHALHGGAGLAARSQAVPTRSGALHLIEDWQAAVAGTSAEVPAIVGSTPTSLVSSLWVHCIHQGKACLLNMP